jgi:hypothetical protein
MVITDRWGFDKIDTLFQRGCDIYRITREKRREKGKGKRERKEKIGTKNQEEEVREFRKRKLCIKT